MGREVRRVSLDFEWPTSKVWEGFLQPERHREDPCPDCESGWSPYAKNLQDQWWGYVAFDPTSTGSTPFASTNAAVRAFAERNVSRAPHFYGTGEGSISREAQRLAGLWNGMWMHHLSQEDVNVLVAEEKLKDLTHTWDRESGWKKIEPPVFPTAAEVNEWSLLNFADSSTMSYLVIKARCASAGVPFECSTCEGHGSLEAYPGQRADAEAWEATEPPVGDGWQLWETTSEGSPVSPVFDTAEDLAQWLTTPAGGEMSGPSRKPMAIDQAREFVNIGWSPTLFVTAGGVHDGAEFVATEAILREHTAEFRNGQSNETTL